ncbi:MAG: hypothetical protein SVR08_07525 [Spirochaetota bacterium]|nr:hypothetical protein [Spirochaetota bacterium]
MNKRKTKLIDKQFHLKTTYSIIGFFFLAIVVIVFFVGINYIFINKKLLKMADIQNEVIISHNRVVDKFQTHSEKSAKTKSKSGLRDVESEIKKSIVAISNNNHEISKIISNNNLIIVLIIAFAILILFIMIFFIIRRASRISGPIYVMTEYINEIIDGGYPDYRPIRKRDEFHDFYELFVKMMDTIKHRHLAKDEKKK